MLSGSKKPIKVGFIDTFSKEWMGGVNYLKNLFFAISSIKNPQIEPIILSKNDDEIINILKPYAKLITINKFKKKLLILTCKLFRKKYSLTSFYKSKEIRVISHSNSFLFEKSSLKTIGWIPDFQHLRLSNMFSDQEIKKRNYEFKHIAKNSNIVILSSYSALKDFKEFSPEFIHKARILQFVAIPDSSIYTQIEKDSADIINKLSIKGKFFYMPNQFWKHKNHMVVFEAVNILKKQGIDIQVLCSGFMDDYRHLDHLENLMTFIKDNSIEDNVKLLGVIEHKEVFFLMRNCVSIINPSLFEGWSTTVEEAKSIGKNIILSNIDVHIEQNPPEGVYFDPYNPQELAEIMKQKWETKGGGPDFHLEEISKSNLKDRIIKFGETYQNYVLELIKS